MNGSRIALLSAMAVFAFPALAEFTTVARAYEVALDDFRAPATANGTASFKACEDCQQMTKRVTPDTVYVLNNRKVRLADFRDAVSRVSNRQDETVIVLHHLELDIVTSISVEL